MAKRLSLLEGLDSFSKAALGLQQNAHHVDSFRLESIAGESSAEPAPRTGRVFFRSAELAPGDMHLHLFGIQGKGLAQMPFGLRRAAALAFQHGFAP
jgi:hypothetical protein